jgi:glycosyltransferase involved in cell wall biosynthesis
MKILIVAPQPFFSPRGTPFSVYYRTLISAELGLDIDFLTYGEGEDVSISGVRLRRIPRFKFLGEVKIGPSPLKLVLDFFILIKLISMLIKNKYDVVHAHEEAVFLALPLKPIFKFKLIYDMHSSLPQQLTNFNFTTSRLLINIFKKLEDASLHSADAIITICPDLFNYVNGIVKNREKHYLIENSIFEDVRLAHDGKGGLKGDNKKVVEILKFPKHKKLIVYAGTLEKYQGIDILIHAFRQVLKKEPSALLIIVGGSPEQVLSFKDLARELKISDSVIFTGRIPQKQAKHYTTVANVLVSPRSEGTNTPLKIYEQLASGIPLVATNIYSHTQVLSNRVAFLVNPESGDMARGILSALSSDGEVQARVTKAHELYERDYSRNIYKEKLTNLFEYLKKCAA